MSEDTLDDKFQDMRRELYSDFLQTLCSGDDGKIDKTNPMTLAFNYIANLNRNQRAEYEAAGELKKTLYPDYEHIDGLF